MRKANRAINLSRVAHPLERVASRATDVCEEVIFVIAGELSKLDPAKS